MRKQQQIILVFPLWVSYLGFSSSRKLMAELDVVKADVKNIVAIAQAKKMVAATASTIST